MERNYKIDINIYNVYIRKICISTYKHSDLCILRRVQNPLYIRMPVIWLRQISILKDTVTSVRF